jgi:hypothetical protein
MDRCPYSEERLEVHHLRQYAADLVRRLTLLAYPGPRTLAP